jgi:hypothetical protein
MTAGVSQVHADASTNMLLGATPCPAGPSTCGRQGTNNGLTRVLHAPKRANFTNQAVAVDDIKPCIKHTSAYKRG